MIKLKSILREGGLLKEQAESAEFKFEFESGQDELSRAGNVELSQLIARVNDMIKRGSKIDKIKIIGSESKVPNQRPFEKPGSLAAARAKALKSLLEKTFPDIDIEMISVDAPVSNEMNAVRFSNDAFIRVLDVVPNLDEAVMKVSGEGLAYVATKDGDFVAKYFLLAKEELAND